MDFSVIDLFCGAGGLSAGLEMAGFRVCAGVDTFEAAGRTFKATHPHASFIKKPIENVTIDELIAASGIKPGNLAVLAGGPPCQAFSVNNRQRGMHDARATLFQEYLRVVEGMRPEWIVMENVLGIYSIDGGSAVRAIKSALKDLGYKVEEKVLKAEEFGVPQARRRVIFIGNRIDAPIRHPNPTHGDGLLPFASIRDAIGDLPPLKNGESGERVNYEKPAIGRFQKFVRGTQNSVANHNCPKLGKVNIERMAHILPGGSWRDIPFDLLPAGMKRAKRSDHTKRYGRMIWDGLSCTILTKCDVHWGAYIHPEQNRSISIREAARFQAFPDWFEFQGSRTDQYTQIGNAVPPLLGQAIGLSIRKQIEESHYMRVAAE